MRDSIIDALLQRLDYTPASDLARIVVDAFKEILQLSADMKDDLSTFVISNLGEKQLQDLVVSQAATFERELVLQTWHSGGVEHLWGSWLEDGQTAASGELSVRQVFVARLTRALGTNTAVSCEVPPALIGQDGTVDRPITANSLPPPLFFLVPSLLRAQNYIQALVIAASLRALVPLPPTHAEASSGDQPPGQELTQRVWTLLKSEIEGEPGADGTKVVNLADEVIRIRRTSRGVDQTANGDEEEQKLRAAVDRTLKEQDPVFQLLQRRLVRALADRLATTDASTDGQVHNLHLRTGRGAGKAQKKPLMKVDVWKGKKRAPVTLASGNEHEAPLVVKGFEDPTLVGAINEVVGILRRTVEWTELVWSDLLEQGSLDVEMAVVG